MIEIIKLLWMEANAPADNEMRKATENYWCMLSRFQPGVGGLPIDF
jgi:hypothetical protein